MDPVYDGLEKQFVNKVKTLEQLATAITTFRDQTSALLDYQQVPSWLEIVEPTLDNSNNTSRAYQDFAMAMEYCSQEVRQSLDQLDSTTVQPLTTCLSMTKSIQKSITKRQHKLIDYDRFRLSYQKLSNMADKSPSEEKNVFKLESQLDAATKDYFYMNDLLKTELEQFLALVQQLIPLLTDTIYNTQCQIYGGIYARIYEIVTSHSGLAFTTMDQSIEQGFQTRWNQRDVDQELRQLDVLQKGAVYSQSSGTLSLQERAALATTSSSLSSQSPIPSKGTSSFIGLQPQQKPPLYHQQQHSSTSSVPTQQYHHQQQYQSQSPVPTQQKTRRPPPPPPPKPKTFSKPIEYAQALYDFEAQEQGDLPLRQGDTIEIIEKTPDAVDWWKGRIGQQVGIFPGNYIQLI
ncbi:uncharacterized protein BX664DRAFT_178397 [Halteromyces radiatus]|uniref:uncharacterized protein n=1 Tax=Halteromyces radiatus TaxID=101107 RepID=UPI00221E4FE6|nr:uncharacterized protein BX664DRAFT_178397 [Halteromyces radiatus]KAI8085092.1 hypothetical protein BX664DRAFT_178397 [Halteromyces radiatus]